MESNLAVLIDFENIAAGTEKEGLGRFDVDSMLQRLKDKGRILVARSYADWGRFARFKQTLLSANVTMMELTSHGMQDKNRADIAMVVDCLELAFTKDYIDTFVVVSGDSDFTPLVLKMRELNKRVIGVGTRSSTSRLLIQACDEFLFYDSIVKETRAPRPARRAAAARGGEAAELEKFFGLVSDALEGIQRENPEPALASVVKTALLRKAPDFNESDLGFSSFARFLDQAQEAGYIELSRDQKSGGYRVDSVDETGPGTGAPLPQQQDEDREDRRGASRDSLPDPWPDPYLPKGAGPFVDALTARGINPLAAPTRMSILHAIEQVVEERSSRRRRVNVQFVQDDVRKRMKKSNAEVPGRAVKSVFNALLRGGLLLHKDGKPIRSGSAPFVLDRSAEKLNRALVDVYLRGLREADLDLSDAPLLAEIFFGAPDRKRDLEEALAWLEEPEGEALPIDDLDDLLLEEHTADEPAPAPQPTSQAQPEPPAQAAVAEEIEEEIEPKPKKPRRTRAPRKKKADASEAIDDLDAVLGVGED